MKIILICFTLLLSSCAPKVLVKNCTQTQDEKFYVCDPVWGVK